MNPKCHKTKTINHKPTHKCQTKRKPQNQSYILRENRERDIYAGKVCSKATHERHR